MPTIDTDVGKPVGMIEGGELRLPEMQRRYVWPATRVRDLLDSLYRGYPSGAIPVWETDREMPSRDLAVSQATSTVPVREYDVGVDLTIDLDREEDGRWIADALELPGVMCYGQTRDEAISNTERLAIEVIADRIAHQELPSSALNVSFTITDEQLARQ